MCPLCSVGLRIAELGQTKIAMNAYRVATALWVGVLAGVAPAVGAAEHVHNTVPAIRERLVIAKITLAQAIIAAEAYGAGAAISAELDEHLGQTAYESEIFFNGKLTNIRVDSRSGARSSRHSPIVQTAALVTMDVVTRSPSDLGDPE